MAELAEIEMNEDEEKDCEIGPKTGVVAIIGRPSVGKSSFLNTASGEKISIVSSVPQTTRNAVKGIVNTSLGQLVFIDTPGYHNSEKKLNLKLKGLTEDQLESCDAILYLLDASREPQEEELSTSELIKPFAKKTVVAINKIDLQNADCTRARLFLAKVMPEIPSERIFDISAQNDIGINEVLRSLFDFAPVTEHLYPTEFYTDQDVDFRIAEIIREQAMNRLYDEIPHALYVEISDMEMRKNGKELWVRAFIVVERESQKGMVIGTPCP